MGWQQQIPACFGSPGNHVGDRDGEVARLQALMREARAAGSVKDEVLEEIRTHINQAIVDATDRKRLLDEAESRLDAFWDRVDEGARPA